MKNILFVLVLLALIMSGCSAVDYLQPAPTATAQPPTVDLQQLVDSAVATAMAQGQAQPTPTAQQPTAAAIAIPTETTAAPTVQVAGSSLPRVGDLFRTPVKCTGKFNDQSSWLICEPGVLLDNTTAWTIPGTTKEPWFVNVPEGGFTYFSMGEGDILIDGVTIHLPGERGLNYLVVIRGRIDDGIIDSDLNETAEVTSFVPGHAIWSHMPAGAYVSRDWFHQQLVASTTGGYTNCGATGCSRIRVVLFDVSSHFYQLFEVRAGELDEWVLVEEN